MRPSLFGVNECIVSGEVSLAPFSSSLKYLFLIALYEKLHSNNWNKNLIIIIIIINRDCHLQVSNVISSAVAKLDRYLSIL